MNELTLDGKIYVSSKRAAEITGYAKDYVGQLCREGRVEARLVGRNWYILKSAIEKHRFADEVVEPMPPKASVEAWERPLYRREESADLPAIDSSRGELEASSGLVEAELAPQTTIEAMQDAWRGWFSSIGEELPQEEVIEEDQIAPEATEEPLSEETAIPMRTITPASEQHEALNLRRIREYREEEPSELTENMIEERSIAPRESRAGYYPILQAIFIFIAVIALSVGYIGAGFASKDIASFGPAKFLAGVATYK